MTLRSLGGKTRDPVLALTLVALALGGVLSHDISYLLTHPFWLDEAWVAVLSDVPAYELRHRAAGVPPGWLLLMRLVPGQSEQRFRLLPLAFSVASILVACVFAYGLGWRRRSERRVAALIAGGAVALAPATLQRNDLKQYTADAFFALLALFLASRLDRFWTRRRFAAFIGFSIGAALFSVASMFVTAALIGAMLVIAAKEDRAQLRDVSVGAVVTAGAFLATALWFVLPSVSDTLFEYWEPLFLGDGGGVAGFIEEVWSRVDGAMTAVGLGNALAGVPLVLLGTLALVRLGSPRVALGFTALVVGLISMALLDRYPFLDSRTSHFVLILFVLVAMTGLTYGIVRTLPSTPARLAASAFLAILIFVSGYPGLRSHSIPNEDVRSQVEFLRDAFRPGDVALVSVLASFGTAYYWHFDHPQVQDNPNLATGWMAALAREDFVFATDRTPRAVEEALDEALVRVNQSEGRLWVVRTHMVDFEREAWDRALADRDLDLIPVPVGAEPLGMVDPGA